MDFCIKSIVINNISILTVGIIHQFIVIHCTSFSSVSTETKVSNLSRNTGCTLITGFTNVENIHLLVIDVGCNRGFGNVNCHMSWCCREFFHAANCCCDIFGVGAISSVSTILPGMGLKHYFTRLIFNIQLHHIKIVAIQRIEQQTHCTIRTGYIRLYRIMGFFHRFGRCFFSKAMDSSWVYLVFKRPFSTAPSSNGFTPSSKS